MSAPTKPGFYWAKWRIAEDGTYAKQPGVSPEEAQQPPSMLDKWEVVEVLDNNNDDEEPLVVFVGGVAKSQSLENFVWGAGPLPAPLTKR